jgi:hypothetical protein
MSNAALVNKEQALEKLHGIIDGQIMPGIPPTEISLKKEREPYNPSREVFVFDYKKGHSMIKVHFQSDSLHNAVRDAKEVCRQRRYIFIGVTPFLRDINRMLEEE